MTDNYFPAEHAIKELQRLAEDAKSAGLTVEEVFQANKFIYVNIFGEEATNKAITKLLMQQDDRIHAPFTDEQITKLNKYQTTGKFHPFTCPRSHSQHIKLIATSSGWVCAAEHCNYKQDWAHTFMTVFEP